jgi:predicted TIM-barrel fold metal-dependent hydrolase
MAGNPRVIALEEHYFDPELKSRLKEGVSGPPHIVQAMSDIGLRLKEMDAGGVDVQVLSHCAPSVQTMEAELAVPMAHRMNDRLYEIVRQHPTRFAGFAALPTADPSAAANELERCITRLDFKGAMIHGLTNGVFLDDKRFWPILQRAEVLDAPIYLHPALPDPTVIDRYYKAYQSDYPSILSAGWGFGIETSTAAVRMVLSGAFNAFPNLKMILGHLGEGLPFLLHRLNESFSRDGKVRFRETFSRHFWITTSGNFSTPALICSVLELGIDRILFSVDYPFVNNKLGTDWIKTVPLCAEDREKILHRNAESLLKM